MESKGNYVITGVFVVIVSAALVVFILWLGKFNEKRQEYDHYNIYMAESVSGLQKDSAVKYMGVEIGKVKKIEIDPKNPEVVHLLIEVPKGTPIRKGMQAQLKSLGITGLSCIEIAGGSKDAPLLKQKEGEIPTIPSKLSIFAKLGVSVEDMSFHISRVSKKLDTLLSDENIRNIKNLLENLKTATAGLQRFLSASNADHLKTTLAHLATATNKLNGSLDKFDRLVDSGAEIPKKLDVLLDAAVKGARTLDQTATQINSSVKRGDYNLRQITQGTVDRINFLIDNLQDLTVRVQAMVGEIEKSPSDLLFKTSMPLLGPGEKKRK
ncbi:MAG: MCE family protein [Nitrospiraceae bacterium]|nr:MCE family protein [Nitrospiraceae bacterium]